MEILVGPALPAHVRAKSAQDSGSVQSDGGGAVMGNRVSGGSEEDNKTGFYFGADGSDRSSSESSSIGVQSDDEEDTNGVVSDKDGDGEEEDEVQSKPSSGLASLDALEDSLPVKRGLSNYFAGKSKSFGNLSEVSAVKDLKKEENPLNKRRRTLLAMRMNKKSFYSWARNQPTSMPLLALAEEEEEEQSSYEDQQVEGEEKQKYGQFRHSKMFAIGGLERKFRGFQSPSCSCLTDLQEEEEEDDYEEE